MLIKEQAEACTDSVLGNLPASSSNNDSQTLVVVPDIYEEIDSDFDNSLETCDDTANLIDDDVEGGAQSVCV